MQINLPLGGGRLPIMMQMQNPEGGASMSGPQSAETFSRESSMYELDEAMDRAKIIVVGVGGAGGNALNTMIMSELDGVEFMVANTDAQALRHSRAVTKIQLGPNLTKGLGAGSNPEVGRQAALEERERIAELLDGADMVFVTAGMGGGTGTGAAPVIAQIAREVKALTVGVVTRPFLIEGKQRRNSAEEGLRHMQNSVDSLIVIPNDRLLAHGGKKLTLKDSFALADSVLYQAVRGISDIIQVPGMINVDFADVQTVMLNQGLALMGVGEGHGETRASVAAEAAMSSPLLDNVNIKGARGVLVNITAPSTFGMDEFETALSIIQEEAHEDVLFKFGVVFDENLQDTIRVTVIATGFDNVTAARQQQAKVANLRTAAGASTWGVSGGAAAQAATRVGTTTTREAAPAAVVRSERDFQVPDKVARHEQLGRVAHDEWADEFDVPAWLRKQRD